MFGVGKMMGAAGLGASSAAPQVPPTFVSAAVNAAGTTLTLTFTVDTAPLLPATGVTGFTSTLGGVNNVVSAAVRASNTTIALTLTNVVGSGQTVLVSYAPGNVTDTNSAALAAFTNNAVTNSSTMPPQANLVLWLEADYGTYSDTARTTPQTTNAGAVLGWADRSLQANHMSNAGAAGTTLKTNAINTNKPSINFNGSAGFTFTSNISMSIGHVFTVIKNVNGSGSVFLAQATNTIYQHITGTNYLINGSPLVPTGGSGFRLTNGNTDGTTISVAVNAGNYLTGASAVDFAYSQLGIYPANATFNIQGEVVGMLMYDAVQTGTNLTAIRDYLNTKYAIY